MFDCLRFLGLTKVPKQISVLAQSSSKNLFVTYFLFKSPHFLKTLAEIHLYIVHKIFKTQSLFLYIVLCFIYQLSIGGHNSK